MEDMQYVRRAKTEIFSSNTISKGKNGDKDDLEI